MNRFRFLWGAVFTCAVFCVRGIEIADESFVSEHFVDGVHFEDNGAAESGFNSDFHTMHITQREIENAIEESARMVRNRIEAESTAQGSREERRSPRWYLATAHLANYKAKNNSAVALIAEETTRLLAERHTLSVDQVLHMIPELDLKSTVLQQYCPLPDDMTCQPHKYRAPDGYCNNVEHATWGSAHTAYSRLIAPAYADGVNLPRVASSGSPLPSARDISVTLLQSPADPNKYVTSLLPFWAQFLSHDLVHTPQFADPSGNPLECCGQTSSECYSIQADGFCQSYARSMPSLKNNCELGSREQMNLATSFLDGSALYGTDQEGQNSLRSFNKGQLKIQPGSLLSQATNERCKLGKKCFHAGDPRVNLNSATSAIYTLFLLEHNRIAQRLQDLNPHWNDEMVFQEAKSVVVAELQHITYKEFLPVVLGGEVTKFFSLDLLGAGFYKNYSMDTYPGVLNSVASSALQFYLPLMPPTLLYYNITGVRLREIPLSSTFFSPGDLYDGDNLEYLLVGLVKGHASKGTSVDREVTDGFGVDLAAKVVQQGRDHGVASYLDWRELCGLPAASDFDDLSSTMNQHMIQKLRKLYSSVSDIDLFVGGLSEAIIEGALVGPTFSCLLGHQFHILRQSDRFWYENDMPPAAFSKEQLYQIRKSSLARLYCDNIKGLPQIQPKLLLQEDTYLNAPVFCEMLPFVDLSAWKSASPGIVVPDEFLRDMVTKAKQDLDRRRMSEKLMYELNLAANPKSSIGTAFAFSRPKPQAIVLANTSLVLEYASTEFMNTMLSSSTERLRVRRQLGSLSNGLNASPQSIQEFGTTLRQVDVSGLVPPPPILDQCRADEETLACDSSSPYRTFSGYCNNLRNPNFGKSVTPMHRLLPAQYDDGLSQPRQRSVAGGTLPSPRLVSTNLHNDVSNPHTRYTMFIMQFGQFLDHDISLTPVNKGFGDSILNCRDCDSRNRVHPECWPIQLPPNDYFYPQVNVSNGRPFCIPFTRSLPGQQTLGPREQIDQNTAYLDASHVYGQDQCEMRTLRTFSGGRLNVTRHPVRGKDLLPQTTHNEECKAPSGYCFMAGDTRASEQPGLAAMHTIFLREHNRIVTDLTRINPHWDDEKLFQTGRKILSAINQHVSYNEFLPRILGWNAMQLYDLRVGTEGFYKGYDDTCSAAILNEFATAAFRFGHSLIRPHLNRMDPSYHNKDPHIQLRDGFFNSDMLYDVQMIDELIRGLGTTPMENLDNFVTDEVTNHLFEEKRVPFSGLDLVALNVQRGRDHGLRPYNEYRGICNLKKARTFEDLSREIPQDLIDRLKRVYASVDDIDLFSGGLSETPLQGGLVGPTFGCIIGLQFRFLKKCDRYWYETEDPAIRFTEQQLAEIRKVTMTHLVCQNCDVAETVQRAVFDMPHDFLNPRIPCRTLTPINLELWREEGGGGQCTINGRAFSSGTSINVSPCSRCSCANGQTTCQSVRITNCAQLLSQHSRDDILRDTSCRVQCSDQLNNGATNGRPQPRPPQQRPQPRPPQRPPQQRPPQPQQRPPQPQQRPPQPQQRPPLQQRPPQSRPPPQPRPQQRPPTPQQLPPPQPPQNQFIPQNNFRPSFPSPPAQQILPGPQQRPRPQPTRNFGFGPFNLNNLGRLLGFNG